MNMATLGGKFALLNRAKVTNDNTGHYKQETFSREGTELGSTSLATQAQGSKFKGSDAKVKILSPNVKAS